MDLPEAVVQQALGTELEAEMEVVRSKKVRTPGEWQVKDLCKGGEELMIPLENTSGMMSKFLSSQRHETEQGKSKNKD